MFTLIEMGIYYPSHRADWRRWLMENHVNRDMVWIVIDKQTTSNPNLLIRDAIEEALCFGWIDSKKRSIDTDQYKLYFSKRKPESTWSKSNKLTIESLIDRGLMTEAGYKTIEEAKDNGYWSVLDNVDALIIPNDLDDAFKKSKGSREFYEGLTPAVKRGLLHWIALAKRVKTRQKRIAELVENARENRTPNSFR